MENECRGIKDGTIGERVSWGVYTSHDRLAPVNVRTLNPLPIGS